MLRQDIQFRLKILKMSKGKCVDCGVELRLRGPTRSEIIKGMGYAKLTLDHILPKSLGGLFHEANLQAMCAPCNSAKGSRPVVTLRKAR